jgi:zinc and cadmium transporter
MNGLFELILLALLGSVIALLGGVVFLSVKKWSRALSLYSVPFAAGVLVTVALMGLLPEASHVIGERAFLVVVISFIGSYLFENLFCELHHHDHSCGHDHHKRAVPLIIIGDTIHNFIDGVAIAASYLVNPGLGLVTAVSTFLHEVPHEIGDFGILLKAGYTKKKVFMVNLVSALMTVVGALVVYFLARGEAFSGYLLAISAGMFLYLGASDFLPHAGEGVSKKKGIAVLLLGVVLMYLTLSVVPHSHEAKHDEHEEEVHNIKD